MRILIYLVLLLQCSLFVAGSLSAQETATPAVAVQSTDFKKYRGQLLELKMPDTITDVNLSDNGRYLLVYMKSLRKLSVYDVNEARIIRELEMATDDALIAASATYFVVVNRTQNLIERWSLGSFRREAVEPLPFTAEVSKIHFDKSSDDTLKISWREEREPVTGSSTGTFLLDIHTFDPKVIPRKFIPRRRKRNRSEPDPIENGVRDMGFCIHPDYFIALPYKLRYGKRNSSSKEYVGIFTRKPVERIGYAEIPFLGILNRMHVDQQFYVNKHVYFIPQADQIISIPLSNDRLHISRFELSKLLQKKSDFLFVSSIPTKKCVRGQEWQYQLEVESKSNEIEVELSAAPDGMQISDSGKLTWLVPETLKQNNVLVILTLTTKSGQSDFQTFHINVHNE